jgi:hypothetical protein
MADPFATPDFWKEPETRYGVAEKEISELFQGNAFGTTRSFDSQSSLG